MLYTFLKIVLYPVLHIFFKIEVQGKLDIDDNKPYIIASNHKSMWDPLLVIITFNKRKIHYIAKKELFQNPILKFILDHTYVIPMDRYKADITGFKKAYKVLKNNELLGIFPQGTRVNNGKEDNSKAGIGMFAIRTNTQIVPVSIIAENNYKPFSKVKVVYHKPYTVPNHMLTEKNNENYFTVSNEVMDIIKKEN